MSSFIRFSAACYETSNLPPSGTVKGKTTMWADMMAETPGMQNKAFAAVLEASQVIDVMHNTNIVDHFFDNLLNGRFHQYL